MKLRIRERRLGWRCGVVALIALVAAVAVPTASAEQAGSKFRRLPMSFFDAGGDFTCAVLKTGAVRCWGRGANGRLGYGNLNDVGDNELPSSSPALVVACVALAVALGGAGYAAVTLPKGSAG